MTDTRKARSAIFARHVHRLRVERGWSQAELGRRLGESGHPLGQSRVAAIEGSGSVTIDQAAAFAEAFGVPIETLLYEEPPATGAVQVRRLSRIKAAVELLDGEVGQLLADAVGDIPGIPAPDAVVFSDSAKTRLAQRLLSGEE